MDKKNHLKDIISGNAGSIPVLLKLYDLFDEEWNLDLALYLGNDLLSTAVKEPRGWSWGSNANGVEHIQHNLTGFSHGAAGIGYALLWLYTKTGKKEFENAAKRAFSYENSWFDGQYDNWPDFRSSAENDSIADKGFKFMNACIKILVEK